MVFRYSSIVDTNGRDREGERERETGRGGGRDISGDLLNSAAAAATMHRLLGKKKVSPEEQAREWKKSINHEASDTNPLRRIAGVVNISSNNVLPTLNSRY